MSEIIVNIDGKEYQIDVQKAKELGVLNEKDTRCKSWEELRTKYSKPDKIGHSYISHDCWQITLHESESIQAFSKLLNLRRDWIGTWEPDWFESVICIEVCNDFEQFEVNRIYRYPRTFSFPTEEMAREFLECFKHLFEECKHLI